MKIFEISKRFPPEEKYALTRQIRRSSRSVCLNLRDAWAKRRYELHFVSKQRAATIAGKGRRLAEERYSPKAVGKALRELYQKIIVRPRRDSSAALEAPLQLLHDFANGISTDV